MFRLSMLAARGGTSFPLRVLRQTNASSYSYSSAAALCSSSALVLNGRCAARLPRSPLLPAAVASPPLISRRRTTMSSSSSMSVSAAAAAAGGAPSSSSPSSPDDKKKKKKPVPRLESDPEAVSLRPETPLASFALADSAGAAAFEGDLLVLGLFEEDLAKAKEEKDKEENESDDDEKSNKGPKFPLDGPPPPCAFSAAGAAAVDAALSGLLTDLALDSDFSGKTGSSAFVRVPRALVSSSSSSSGPGKIIKFRSVGLVGLGPRGKAAAGDALWGKSPFAALGAAVASAAKQHKAATAGVAIFENDQEFDAPLAAEGIARGLALGAYEATRFKHGPAPSRITEATLLFPAKSASDNSGVVAAAAAKGNAVASGVLLARYLVEAPPNVCTPRHLARAAESIASASPDVFSVEVLGRKECEEMGMGSFLGVAACSELEPQFIHLTYTPPGFDEKGAEEDNNNDVALVGKGLTFDSGGYNLKVGGMIEMMKFDMGGAAAVLGAADALSKSKPATKGRIHVIVAACENMIDGKGMRPGDVLTSASGKTIEVNNTDAEGRLTLADALWYAQNKANARAVVDVATLTGACMVALGPSIAGLMAPDDAAADAVSAAAKKAGEKVWRLPLDDSYWDQMKSSVADMKNSGGRFGGAITAGLFLKQFVEEGVEFAHVDIAGPAWSDAEGGATGFGVATLAEWASAAGERLASKEKEKKDE